MNVRKAVALTTLMVASTASAAGKKPTPPPAPVPETGATLSLLPGDDASSSAGIPFPTPRFVINLNGTVDDRLTGLVWLKTWQCGYGDWPSAVALANSLSHGLCGLTDGSMPGDWRLPNIRELFSLLNYGIASGTMVDKTAFADLCVEFWSSTPVASQLGYVYAIRMDDGRVEFARASAGATIACFWAVRDR